MVGELKKTHTISKFKEKGILTPKEFIQTGSKLKMICPIWNWGKGKSKGYQNKDLPEDK